MNIRTRIVLFTLILLALVVPGAQAQQRTDQFVRAHSLAFEMNAEGVIRPLSHAIRDRELEPKTEEQLQAALEEQRVSPPVSRGRLVLRAHDARGNVIYRAMEMVVLERRIYGGPAELKESVSNPVFTTVVPAAAVSIEFEGWLPASRTTFFLSDVEQEHGEASSGRLTTHADAPKVTLSGTVSTSSFSVTVIWKPTRPSSSATSRPSSRRSRARIRTIATRRS